MAVKIKLKRLGKIREPYYRIVVADARTKRDGRAIEEIGRYHPKAEPSLIEVNSRRVQHWLSVGAQPTDQVRNLLTITGDWQRFRGEPGAEGTLRTAAPRPDPKERFAAAVAAVPSRGGQAAPPSAARPAGSSSPAGAAARQDRERGSGRGGASARAARSGRGKTAAGAEPGPDAEAKAGSEPAGSEPAGSQPAGSQPAGSQPAGSQPAGSQPAGSQPAGSEQAAAERAGGGA